MAKDSGDATPDLPEDAEDLRELRKAVLDLGKALRVFGKSRLAALGEDVSEEAEVVTREGRRLLHDVEQRVVRLEKHAEKSVREHPAAWATGLLGVIGFGLVLGLILRHRD